MFASVNRYLSLFIDNFNRITSGNCKNIILAALSLIVRRVPALTASKNETFIGATRSACGTRLNFDCNDGTKGSGGTSS